MSEQRYIDVDLVLRPAPPKEVWYVGTIYFLYQRMDPACCWMITYKKGAYKHSLLNTVRATNTLRDYVACIAQRTTLWDTNVDAYTAFIVMAHNITIEFIGLHVNVTDSEHRKRW